MVRLANAKAKGNAFERKVAEMLTEAFGATFTRVPNSGAYTGGSNASRKDTLDDRQQGLMRGDIIPPEELSHLVIECKHRKDFDKFPWSALGVMQKWGAFDAALNQVMADCTEGSVPMLFFQGNRTPTMLAMHVVGNDVPELVAHIRYYDWVIMNADRALGSDYIRSVWVVNNV